MHNQQIFGIIFLFNAEIYSSYLRTLFPCDGICTSGIWWSLFTLNKSWFVTLCGTSSLHMCITKNHCYTVISCLILFVDLHPVMHDAAFSFRKIFPLLEKILHKSKMPCVPTNAILRCAWFNHYLFPWQKADWKGLNCAKMTFLKQQLISFAW